MDLKSKIILISGPTASGKSKAALKIAKKLNGEIINADSMQVYKELNILTARPSKIDLNKINHHLYGFRSVKKEFSSGDWLKLAKKNALIMHPGPMNRGVEIDTNLADDINRSVIREQVELGVAVRMACLKIFCKQS